MNTSSIAKLFTISLSSLIFLTNCSDTKEGKPTDSSTTEEIKTTEESPIEEITDQPAEIGSTEGDSIGYCVGAFLVENFRRGELTNLNTAAFEKAFKGVYSGKIERTQYETILKNAQQYFAGGEFKKDSTAPSTDGSLSSTIDSASFGLGIEYASIYKNSFPNLNIAFFSDAFNKGWKNEPLEITAIQAKEILDKIYVGKAEAEGKAFMAKIKDEAGVTCTPSGLCYKVVKKGSGAKPSAEDKVTVHYEGRLTDGKIFDSSFKRKKPASFPLNRVIPGWTEGLQLMNKGAKYIFYIPQHLGYGARGTQGIPGFSTLIFEVELLDIEPAASN